MSFPTSGEIASFGRFLKRTTLQGLVAEARPELAEQVAVGEHREALTIDLPPTPAGYHRRVVAGLARGGHGPHWLLAGTRTHSLIYMVWDADTADEVLRDAVLALYDACLAEGDLASPWRWDEPAPRTIVEVADGLAAAGMEITGVAGANRTIPDEVQGSRAPVAVPESFGDALRVKMPWGTGTLARKPTLGWVFDAHDGLLTRRLDLAMFATGASRGVPGLVTDDPELLVRGVVGAVQAGPWEALAGEVSPVDVEGTEQPLQAAAAWWLREFGYAGVEPPMWDHPGVRGPVHVVVTETFCRLGAIKTAFADAAVEGKALVIFSVGGYTRDATAWADRAGVALYSMHPNSYRAYPASALAREHVPKLI